MNRLRVEDFCRYIKVINVIIVGGSLSFVLLKVIMKLIVNFIISFEVIIDRICIMRKK